jgi:hypothetical protein
VSQYKLAKEIGVPARRIDEIVHGQRRISADTALRLARFFGTSERFWINLQAGMTWGPRKTGSAARSTGPGRSAPPGLHKPAGQVHVSDRSDHLQDHLAVI